MSALVSLLSTNCMAVPDSPHVKLSAVLLCLQCVAMVTALKVMFLKTMNIFYRVMIVSTLLFNHSMV